MELSKKYIHMNREKGKAATQITLDDDFNVPDTKPDLIRIILDKGEIRLDETTITQDHVWLKGSVLKAGRRPPALLPLQSPHHKFHQFPPPAPPALLR